MNQTNEGKGWLGAKSKYWQNWPNYNQRVDGAKDEEVKSQSICNCKLLYQKVNSRQIGQNLIGKSTPIELKRSSPKKASLEILELQGVFLTGTPPKNSRLG